MVSAAAMITSPTTAPIIVFRALAALEASPAEVIYMIPPTMMTMMAATPAMVASTNDTRFRTPFCPEMGSLVLPEQASEPLAEPLQAQDSTLVLFEQASGVAALALDTAPAVRVRAKTTARSRAER